MLKHEFVFAPAQKLVGDFLQTFVEFPPRQKAASFSLSDVLDKLASGVGSK